MRFLNAIFGAQSTEDSAISSMAEVKEARKAAKKACGAHVEAEGVKNALKERGLREAIKTSLEIDSILA